MLSGLSGSSGATRDPQDVSFTLGFLAALGAKEVGDQAASQQRESMKAQKQAMSSPAQMLQGNLGPLDQLLAMARFQGAGPGSPPATPPQSPIALLASRMSGASPQAPPPGGPPLAGGPAATLPSPGAPSPMMSNALMNTMVPPQGGGGMNPMIMALLQQRMASAGGMV